MNIILVSFLATIYLLGCIGVALICMFLVFLGNGCRLKEAAIMFLCAVFWFVLPFIAIYKTIKFFRS